MSQIERGKTRPTKETVEWLAQRLGVDASFLANGVSVDVRSRIEAALARGEALSRLTGTTMPSRRFARRGSRSRRRARPSSRCALAGEGWALAERGEAREALPFCSRPVSSPRARSSRTSTGPMRCSGSEFAATSWRVSRRPWRSSTRLTLAEGSALPCDLLRADILGWRSCCRRHQRDFEAAHEDVERALELAQAMDDRRLVANTYFQASLVAERMGHWVLSRTMRSRRRRSRGVERRAERQRLMLNLGGLNLLLGKPQQAIDHLKASFELAVEADSQPDAAQALGSLATVHLHLGDNEAADEHARKALGLLQGQDDFLHEVGQSNVARPLAPRARALRGGGGVLLRLRTPHSSNSAPSAIGRGVGRAGRPCESSWGRPRGSALVPKRRRGASRHPLLREEDMVKARLLTLAVTLALLAGAIAPGPGTPGRTATRGGFRCGYPCGR